MVRRRLPALPSAAAAPPPTAEGADSHTQVCFEGDPEGALITFSNHTEANVAYKSTEANKQENMAPSGQQKLTNSQQPTSHNKEETVARSMSRLQLAQVSVAADLYGTGRVA
ncbi:hypothetical protein MSG28_015451 [Choristoneura fumiferana]|uniref:Uncharacterized protein n=1 Tax=Choristoneura fumiferana TaxID=7141 RepID=A0ACC0KBI3_CHOFU|nr:hypothetical protein MSG28_015451 [Choristoneura fumiferana]